MNLSGNKLAVVGSTERVNLTLNNRVPVDSRMVSYAKTPVDDSRGASVMNSKVASE